MTKIFSLLLFIIPVQLWGNIITAKVVNVIDGNTIEVETVDDGIIQILLSEVDCPEIGQNFAEEAKKLTESLILKKKIHVELVGKDRWGNKLAVVLLKNGTNLNHELIKAGLAWANLNTSERMAHMQAEAQSGKKGLWVEQNPEAPWVYRRKQTMLRPKGM